VRHAELPEEAVVLDLASGTGDFSRLVRQYLPKARAVAVDITEKMLHLARTHGINDAVCSDATTLPFPNDSFDCVFIGYGLRNFPDLQRAMREIERVTKPGGLLVSLDFFLPKNLAFRKAYLGYLFLQGAFWGLLLHGRPRIYTYIPDSLRNFLSMDEFAGVLKEGGYQLLDSRGYIFGGIGLHWAMKRLRHASS
jgi:demethylmenaquinone methyltransferase / 2-methoxy-6-polyprenyl-1,4-benzoquinol methylase